MPAAKCRFVKWNDGVTSNPRTVIITKDYTFTAIFAAVAGSAEEKIGEQQEYDDGQDRQYREVIKFRLFVPGIESDLHPGLRLFSF